MATFELTWTGPTQAALASSVQVEQYQDLFLLYHAQLKARGYTVSRSSDGTTAADSDLVSERADVIWGTGSQAKSWVLYYAPSGKGKQAGSPGLGLLMLAQNINTDTTPNAVQFKMGAGALTTAGSHTIIPAFNSESQLSFSSVPQNSDGAASTAIWTNSNDDLYVGFKRSGDVFFSSFLIVADDHRAFPLGCSGNNGLFLIANGSTASTGAIVASMFSSGTMAVSASGAIQASVTANANVLTATNWPAGKDAPSGLVPFEELVVLNNSAASGGTTCRVHGRLIDARAVPQATPFNEIDALDDGVSLPYRLRCLGGNLALPSNAEIWVSNP